MSETGSRLPEGKPDLLLPLGRVPTYSGPGDKYGLTRLSFSRAIFRDLLGYMVGGGLLLWISNLLFGWLEFVAFSASVPLATGLEALVLLALTYLAGWIALSLGNLLLENLESVRWKALGIERVFPHCSWDLLREQYLYSQDWARQIAASVGLESQFTWGVTSQEERQENLERIQILRRQVAIGLPDFYTLYIARYNNLYLLGDTLVGLVVITGGLIAVRFFGDADFLQATLFLVGAVAAFTFAVLFAKERRRSWIEHDFEGIMAGQSALRATGANEATVEA